MAIAHRCKPKDPLRGPAISRTGGKCEATMGLWGDHSARRCGKPMDDVFIDENKAYVVLCVDCRTKSLGLTSGERGRRVKQNRLAQTSLLSDDQKKEKARE